MAIAVEELLGYKVGYTGGSDNQQQSGSDQVLNPLTHTVAIWVQL